MYHGYLSRGMTHDVRQVCVIRHVLLTVEECEFVLFSIMNDH